jgi:RND family efflux transporter MFP subunit
MTMKRTNRTAAWVMAGFAFVSLFGLPGCSNRESAVQAQADKPQTATHNPQSAVRVKVARPTREHLKHLSTPQPAHVGPYEKADIYAKVAGYVQMLGPALGPDRKALLDQDGQPRPLDIGDRVEKDQVLAKLWVPEMEKELELKKALTKQSEADVKKYEAERVFREAELARLEKMVKDKSVEEARLDEKRLQRDAVQAAIASAEARVQVAMRETEHLQTLLNYATIRAPFTGLLTRRLVDTGAFVQSAATGKPEPLFTLARIDRLRIIADIPEADASLVTIGQSATFQTNASRGQSLAGKVVRFADALESGTRTMRTEVELDAQTKVLRPGMFGSVTILLADSPDALMLPTTALLSGDGKTAVLIVEEGRALKREVELGLNDGVRMQVLGGLAGSEQVIVVGKDPVREGQPVEVAP